MRTQMWLWMVVLAAASAAAAGSRSTSTLRQAMQQVVAPQAQVIWNISNAALDKDGNVIAADVKTSDWDRVLSAARRLKSTARELVSARQVVVAEPEEKIQDEGNADASDAAGVQRYIEAQPKAFRTQMSKLETAANMLIAVASAHDAAGYSRVSNALDQICEDCHVKFWYPQLKKP